MDVAALAEKIEAVESQLVACRKALNNYNSDEYFQNGDDSFPYQYLKNKASEQRLDILMEKEKSLMKEKNLLMEEKNLLMKTQLETLQLQKMSISGDHSIVGSSDRSKGNDSRLRYTRLNGRDRIPGLSYETRANKLVALFTPSDGEQILELNNVPNYEEIWDIASGRDGFKFLQDGEMDDATRKRVMNALQELSEAFDETHYRISIDLVTRKQRKTDCTSVGEMFYQQFIYGPFSGLLLSACFDPPTDYKADEMVTSNLPCKYRETAEDSSWKVGNFFVKPDASSTVKNGFESFAMMELMPSDPNPIAVRKDTEKCIAVLSSTLIDLDRVNIDTAKLYFPFIIGDGFNARLYVVHFGQTKENETGEKIPNVLRVGNDYNLKSDETRTQLFIALAVLLHNAKKLLSTEETKDKFVRYRAQRFEDRSLESNAFATTSKRKSTGTDTSRTSTEQRKKKKKSVTENKNKEDLAFEAARCDGLFSDIDLAWPRSLFIGEDFTPEYQEKSPYYFVGIYASTREKCFLKIWREDEEGFGDARDEIRFLKQAQLHNVAVAKSITDDVVSVNVNGIKFEVLATEYIESSAPASVDELMDFSLSLMNVVGELHQKAGVLHCDIKPNNLRWLASLRRLHLIDFGHSQLIKGARHYKATKDFEAPEIREKRLPHSRETDAYSVGATILWAWNDYMRRLSLSEGSLDRKMKKLRVVGESLSAPRNDRISLNRGIRALLETLEESKCGDGLLSSCGKRPRVEDIGSTLQHVSKIRGPSGKLAVQRFGR